MFQEVLKWCLSLGQPTMVDFYSKLRTPLIKSSIKNPPWGHKWQEKFLFTLKGVEISCLCKTVQINSHTLCGKTFFFFFFVTSYNTDDYQGFTFNYISVRESFQWSYHTPYIESVICLTLLYLFLALV